jgi:hypothetical protein
MTLPALILALTLPAAAVPVTIAWDAPPEPVTSYRVTYVQTPLAAQTVNVAITQATMDLPPGTWTFSVSAANAMGRSPESATLVYQVQVLPSAPTNLRVVEIQTSSNLRDWKTVALIPQFPDEIPAEFVRARIANR